MKKIQIEFNWLECEPLYLIPTIVISKDLRYISVLFLKWSLDFNY